MNGIHFESCIKYAACTATCPASWANPCYPDPKRTGLDGEHLCLKDDALYDEALKYCTNCKRCEAACPSDVRVGDIIQRVRAQYGQQKPILYDAIFNHADLMGTLSTPFVPLVNVTTGLKSVCRLFDAALKIDHRCTPPKYGFGAFRRAYHQLVVRQAQYPKQAVFFYGCYVNYNHSQPGRGLVRVVNALGIGVQLLSKERYCGVSLIVNGFFDKTRKQVQNNVAVVRENTPPTIATSSAYIFTLRDECPYLLDINSSDLRDRVGLVTRWIWKQLDVDKALPLRRLPPKAVCHTPRHVEKMGWSPYTLGLLQLVPGLQLEMSDSQCCGTTGTYGFKTGNCVVPQAIGASLFRQIKESGTDIVVTDCEICK